MSEGNNMGISFDLPKNQSSVIKVIGVGGGGSNAVNHMFHMGIRGVDFVICNTDSQALENSPIPNKIQLGVSLTEGLGAGANPEIGAQSAIESIEELKKLLETNTKMVFITAGMGGGTGTGAAPIIAKAAKESGVLTVGIVTIPFMFEGNTRMKQAEKGIDELRNNVDSLIVINNNKLREVYGNLGFKTGFAKADEVLATAARGIAEVITHHYTQNIDLRDAKTVLADSGTAIMGSATASGENRAIDAISSALDSPLLNDNHIKGAKNVLLLIVSGNEEITIDEIGEINDFIQQEAGGSANIIMGIGEDEKLSNEVSVTIVATGFETEDHVHVIPKEPKKVVHTLEEDQPVSHSLLDKEKELVEDAIEEEDLTIHDLDSPINELEETAPTAQVEETEEVIEEESSQPSFGFDFEPTTDEAVEEDSTEEIAEEPVAEEKKEEVIRFELIDEEEETEEDSAPINPIENNTDEEEDGFSFELTSTDEETEELSEPTAEIEAEKTPDATEQKEEITRFQLDDYLEFESQLKSAKSENANSTPSDEKELNIELKEEKKELPKVEKKQEIKVEEKTQPIEAKKDVSPMDSSIADAQQQRASERKARLQAFNYRFRNTAFIDEVENEPAYKRMGVDLSNTPHSSESGVSRLTLSDDDNNNTEIRSNNSFLHDNVD